MYVCVYLRLHYAGFCLNSGSSLHATVHACTRNHTLVCRASFSDCTHSHSRSLHAFAHIPPLTLLSSIYIMYCIRFVGCGDLFTACLLGHMHAHPDDFPLAFELTCSAVHGVVERTANERPGKNLRVA